MKELTETTVLTIDWEKLKKNSDNVIPCVVQEMETKEVLMVAYVNESALLTTIKTGLATFLSTSRKCLWVKGTESGNYLKVQEIRVNCEQNSLLYFVKPARGGTCHTKDALGKNRKTCFYRKMEKGGLIFVE